MNPELKDKINQAIEDTDNFEKEIVKMKKEIQVSRFQFELQAKREEIEIFEGAKINTEREIKEVEGKK